MKPRIEILSVLLGVVACSFAQVIRFTSRLWVGMPEEEISSALDKPSGLKSGDTSEIALDGRVSIICRMAVFWI
jgi:hypothetical protein